MIDAPCLVALVVADCMTLVVATFPLATAGPVSIDAWPFEEFESADVLSEVFPVALLLPVVAAAVPELVTFGRWSTMLNPPGLFVWSAWAAVAVTRTSPPPAIKPIASRRTTRVVASESCMFVSPPFLGLAATVGKAVERDGFRCVKR